MSDTITKPHIKDEIKIERPPLHKVTLVNDDYTPRAFVVTVLKGGGPGCRAADAPRQANPDRPACFPAPLGPSPFLGRVGVHDSTFKAWSGFASVTACRI